MKKFYTESLITLVLILTISIGLFAQNDFNVQYQLPVGNFYRLSVCGDAQTHTVRLQNISGEDLQNATVKLNLPSGIFYTTGSLAGGTEMSATPAVFEVGDFTVGQVKIISFDLDVDCDGLALALSSSSTNYTLDLCYVGGDSELTNQGSPNFEVVNPVISFPQIVGNATSNNLFDAAFGLEDTLKVHVVNGGEGSLREFTYCVANTHPYLNLTKVVVAGMDVPLSYTSPSGDSLYFRMDADEIANAEVFLGNPIQEDDLFQFNEKLIVCEIWEAINCPDPGAIIPDIERTAYYGCDGVEVCQETPTSFTGVRFGFLGPDIRTAEYFHTYNFDVDYKDRPYYSDCYDSDENLVYNFAVINTGNANMLLTEFDLTTHTNNWYYSPWALDENSVVMYFKNGAVTTPVTAPPATNVVTIGDLISPTHGYVTNCHDGDATAVWTLEYRDQTLVVPPGDTLMIEYGIYHDEGDCGSCSGAYHQYNWPYPQLENIEYTDECEIFDFASINSSVAPRQRQYIRTFAEGTNNFFAGTVNTTCWNVTEGENYFINYYCPANGQPETGATYDNNRYHINSENAYIEDWYVLPEGIDWVGASGDVDTDCITWVDATGDTYPIYEVEYTDHNGGPDTLKVRYQGSEDVCFDLRQSKFTLKTTTDCDEPAVQFCNKTVSIVKHTHYVTECDTDGTKCFEEMDALRPHVFTIQSCYCAPCEGMVFTYLDIARQTFGVADPDNDGIPEAGVLDDNLINKARFIAGDTIRASYGGWVNLITKDNFEYAYATIDVPIIGSGTNALGDTGITPLSAMVQIWDQSTGAKYECDLVQLFPDGQKVVANLSVGSLISLGCTGMPTDFVYEQGDSIAVDFDFRLKDYRTVQTVVNFGSQYYMTDQPYDIGTHYQCNTLTQNMTYIPYRVYNEWVYREIGGCNDGMDNNQNGTSYNSIASVYDSHRNLFRLGSTGFDYFPFEVRELAKITQQTYVNNSDLEWGNEFKILIYDNNGHLTETGGTLSWQRYTLDMTTSSCFAISGNTLVVDFECVYAEVGYERFDEGMDIYCSPTLSPTCNSEYEDGGTYKDIDVYTDYDVLESMFCSPTWTAIDTSIGVNEGIIDPFNAAQEPIFMVNRSSIYTGDYIQLTELPNISLQPYSVNQTLYEEEACFNVDISNIGSGPAENVFFTLENISGGIIFQGVNDLTNDEELPVNVGVVNLGSLGVGETRELEFCVTSNNCNRDSILINTGWDCTGLPSSPAEANCTSPVSVYLEIPNSELGMIIQSPDPTVPHVTDLCEEVEYVVQLSSSDIGALHDINFQFNIPTGMDFVPGSFEIAYPVPATGSPTWMTTVNQPTNTSGSQYNIVLDPENDLLAADGLPGTTDIGMNFLLVRFRTFVGCGSFSGSRVRFLSWAYDPCDKFANYRFSPGPEIKINGVSDSYVSSLSVPEDEVLNACEGNSVELGVNFSLAIGSLPVGPTDSVMVELPYGINYVPGSYTPITNATAATATNPRVVTNAGAQTIFFDLLDGVMAGETIDFTFEVAADDVAQACRDYEMIIRTFNSQVVYCEATDEFCDVKTTSDEVSAMIEIVKPDLEISNLNISSCAAPPDMEEMAYCYDLKNTGTGIIAGTTTVVEFYNDANNNGDFDSGMDILLSSVSTTVAIPNGATITVCDTTLVPSGMTCNVISVINPEVTCVCDANTSFRAHATLNQKIEEVEWTVCSNTLIEDIGPDPLDNVTYEWVGIDGASTVGFTSTTTTPVNYQFQNTTGSTIEWEYYLRSISNGDCAALDTISITIYPEEHGEVTLQACPFDEFNLAGPTGNTNYQWSPSLGLTDDNAANTNVDASLYPEGVHEFVLTYTDKNGCPGDFTAEVTIVPCALTYVGNYVWCDDNNNGIQDDDPIEGITVQLFGSTDPTMPVATTITDANGAYLFGPIPQGEYIVGLDLGWSNYQVAMKDATTDDLDNDLNPNFQTDAFYLSNGDSLTTIDLGILCPVVDLELEKNAVTDKTTGLLEAVTLGDTVYWTIDVCNRTMAPDTVNFAADSVQVTELLPEGIGYLSHTVTQGSYDPVSGLWDLGRINNGSCPRLCIASDIMMDILPITNTSEITYGADPDIDSEPENDDGDQSEDDEDNATIYPKRMDLALTKIVSTSQMLPVEAGGDVTFTIAVCNQGNVPAYNIEIVDYIPSGMNLNDSDWTPGGLPNEAFIEIPGPLALNVCTSVDITLMIDPAFAGDTLTNFAEISSQEFDDGTYAPDVDSNTDSDPGNDGPVTDQQTGNLNNDEDDHDPAGIHVTMIECAVGNNGPVCPGASVTLTENGGDASAWSWSGPGGFTSNVQNPTANPALPGIYTVTITDPNGFMEVCQTEVSLLPGIEVNGLSSDVSCNMGTNGSIDINVSGGTAPYSYDWSNDGAENPDNDNQDVTNLSAGNYTVTVTDILGCIATAGFTVTQPTAVSCAATSQSASCNGQASGSVTVIGAGGTAPYEYSFNGGPYQPSGLFSNIAAGNYNVTTRDANNCVSICSVSVTEPSALTCSLTGTDVSDCELQDGTVTVTAVGGTAPYSYAINGGATQNSDSFSSLMAGMHTVEVTDDNGCTSMCQITLSAPSVPTCQISSFENIDCNGAATGSITVTGSGGTAPYEYSLDNSAYQSSNTFTGLAAGLHIIYVRNTANPMCISMCSMLLTEPTALFCELAATNVSCLNGTDGVVTVNATGGETPYEYSIDGGAWQPGSNFSGLTAGAHNVTVRDKNLCTSTCSVVVMEPELLTCTIMSTDAKCFATATGSIIVTGSGGVAPYEYSLNNGGWQVSNLFDMLTAGSHSVTTRDANGCTNSCNVVVNEPNVLACTVVGADLTDCMVQDGKAIVSVTGGTAPYKYRIDGGTPQNENEFTGLIAGMHNLEVRDANGCTTSCQITLDAPTSPNCSITAFSHISCNGGVDGSITVEGSGGSTPFEYSLDNMTFQSSGTFNGLTAGTHNIYVRNMASPMCITMCGMELTEPTLLICDHTQTAVSCNGGADAMIFVNATGGVTPYEYSLNGAAWQPGFTFEDLKAGEHIIVVRDANLCLSTCMVTVNEPSSLSCTLESADALCNGSATGTIAVSATGGVGDYEYNIDNGPWQLNNQFLMLEDGTYTITVRDGNDCVSNCTITINEPGQLSCTLVGTDITDCAIQDGTVTVTAVSGTAPYMYSINGGAAQSSNLFTELIAGTHSIVVTDDNGCQSTCEISLGAPTTPICEITDFTHIACNGDASGSITTMATGGVLPYEYSLDNITYQSSGTFNNLLAGTHTIYVRNVGSPMCISICSMELTEPTLLVCTHEQINVSCFDGHDGMVSITATGGVTNYEYSLDGSPWQPGNTFDELSAGSYITTVRDANGCTTTCAFTIEQPTALSCSLTKTDVVCNGDGSGSITASANGGVLPYEYSLEGSPWQSGNSFLSVIGGSYTVSVRDANECISTCEITVEEPEALTCTLEYIKPESCAFNDGEISVNVIGGTLPLEYSLDDGATFQGSTVFTGLSNGTYTVLSVDGNGCEVECTFTVAADCFDLALEKELITESPYVYGQLVSFDITVVNQGNIDATHIEITEHIPCGFSYDPTSLINLSNNWTPLVTANPMTTIDKLDVGAKKSVRIELMVEECLEPGGYLNTAEVSGASDSDGDPIKDTDSTPDYDPDNDPETEDDHDTELLPIYDPSLKKELISSAPYTYGDELLFVIEVCNQNSNEITNVSVVDYMPDGYSFDALLNPGWTLNAGSVLSYTYNDQILEGGECGRIPLYLILEMGDSQEDWHNIAEIQHFTDENGNPQTDTDATNDRDKDNDGDMVDDEVNNEGGDEDDSDYAEPYIVDAALIKTTEEIGPFAYGDVVTFDIKVYNQGATDLYNITLNDAIPCGFKYVSTNDSSWTFDSGTTVAQTKILGPIVPGDSMTVSIDLEIKECHTNGAYTNIAEIQSFENEDGDDITLDDIDSNADDNTSNDEVCDNKTDNTDNDEDDHDPETIEIFDLSLDKELVTALPYGVGDLLEFQFTIVNEGNVPAMNINIADHLPLGFSFDEILNPGWSAVNAPMYEYTVTHIVSPGDSAFVSIFVTLEASFGGEEDYINTAEIITAEDEEGDPTDDADSDPDTDPNNDPEEEDDHDRESVILVDMALIKTTNTAGSFAYGDIITFDFEIFNQGVVDVYEIRVNDFIPCGYEYVSSNDSDWTFDASENIATTIISGPIAGGMSETVSIDLRLQSCNPSSNDAWTNVAEIEKFEDENGIDITDEDVDSDGDNDPNNDILVDDVVDNKDDDEDDHDTETLEIFDLALQKTANVQGTNVSLGDTVEYWIHVYNQGNVTAEKLEVIDYLDAPLLFDATLNTGWTINTGNLEYTADGPIVPGDNLQIPLYLVVDPNAIGFADAINFAEITGALDADGNDRTADDIDSNTDDNEFNDVGGEPGGDTDDHILDNGFDGNGDGIMDEDDHDPARVIIFECHEMACIGFINLSLDESCMSVITPTMILDPIIAPNDDVFYTIEIVDGGGNIVDNEFDHTDIGMTFEVTVTILPPASAPDCAANSCSSMVTVEDKWMPSITCEPAIDVACNALHTVLPPEVADNCGGAMAILVNESEVVYDCHDDYLRTITRTYKAVDGAGNESDVCDQVINVMRVNLTGISFPGHFVSNVCTTSTDPVTTGVPMHAGIAIYPDVPDILCNVSVNFEDINIQEDNCHKTFTRIWRVTEWHCGTTVGPMQWVQEITVHDVTAPTITCPDDLTFTTDVGYGTCVGTVTLPAVTVNDDCNNPVEVTINGGSETIFANGGTTTLPVGTSTITYIAYDGCYNSSACSIEVTVMDQTQPTTVCKQDLVVSISSNGLAEIAADAFNLASFDDCEIDRYEVARMTDPCGVSGTGFASTVTFCCTDIGMEVMVMMRVYDTSGNFSDCMVMVEVQDKEEATIACPADQTVECTMPYDISNLATFFGEATVGDNCGNHTITESVVDNVDQCGLGTLERTFTIPDGVGGTATCTQVITFINSDPFDGDDPMQLSWPEDLTIDGMCTIDDVHPDNLSAPHDYPFITEDACDMVGANFTDQVFDFIQGEDACFKVIRTWRVTDWCQRLPTGLFKIWEYEQVIKVTNSSGPMIVSGCEDQIIETSDCIEEFVILELTGTDDCTSAEGLSYYFEVDIFSDGSINYTNNTNSASALYPLGEHTITWILSDGCGNETTCTSTFEVRSTKAPAAVCKSLTAPLIMMDTNGDGMNDTEMVILNAIDFDASSSHPCDLDITFSFSQDPMDQTMTFDCDDQGQQGIMLWVTDENGNQAFCNTFVIITDPDNSCPMMITVDIQGRIFTEDNDNVEAVNVELLGSLLNEATTEQGDYGFMDMPMGGAYIVDPVKTDDVDNGVSTLDLVLIQKHLLQLQLLSSPYKLIAADINHDEKISALDLIQLRKLILGVTDEFPNNDSWRFVDALYQFPIPTDPWIEVFPEDYEIPALNTHMNADFIGVKIGDVNGSVEANFESIVVEKRSSDPVVMSYRDRVVEKGELVEVLLRSDNFINIAGFQFTLQHKGLELESIDASNVSLSDANKAAVDNDHTSFSWNDKHGETVTAKDRDLFSISFIANRRVRLSDVLDLNSLQVNAEAYQLVSQNESERYDVIDIVLEHEDEVSFEEVQEFVLYQNEPNPWSQMTTIMITSQIEGTATLTIADAMGRNVMVREIEMIEGMNEITITKNEVVSSGMYFYSLQMNETILTKQMVKVE